MQEVSRSEEQLEAILGRSYDCQVNLNPDDQNQPGTAVAWRNNLEVEVIPVISGRLQLVTEIYCNVVARWQEIQSHGLFKGGY
jgi:hypothetical protein